MKKELLHMKLANVEPSNLCYEGYSYDYLVAHNFEDDYDGDFGNFKMVNFDLKVEIEWYDTFWFEVFDNFLYLNFEESFFLMLYDFSEVIE